MAYTKEELTELQNDPLVLIKSQAIYLSICVQNVANHDKNFRLDVRKQFVTIRKTIDDLELIYLSTKP